MGILPARVIFFRNFQEVADYVAGMARRRGFDAAAAALDSVPVPQVLESSLAVFVVSTTGDGEVPSNMSTFWRFLLRRCARLRLRTMHAVYFMDRCQQALRGCRCSRTHLSLERFFAEFPRGVGANHARAIGKPFEGANPPVHGCGAAPEGGWSRNVCQTDKIRCVCFLATKMLFRFCRGC